MEYVNADTIALGLSAFRPERAAFTAGRVMLQQMRALAKRRESFAFESTLASRSYARWIIELRRLGYDFHLLFLWLSNADLALARVKERVRLGGHDVPEEVIRRRYDKGMKNFFELYQQLATSWGIYDNSTLGESKLIAMGTGKTILSVFDDRIWHKFSGIKK